MNLARFSGSHGNRSLFRSLCILEPFQSTPRISSPQCGKLLRTSQITAVFTRGATSARSFPQRNLKKNRMPSSMSPVEAAKLLADRAPHGPDEDLFQPLLSRGASTFNKGTIWKARRLMGSAAKLMSLGVRPNSSQAVGWDEGRLSMYQIHLRG